MSKSGEFAFIAQRLAPLSRGAPGAAGLRDDGALIDLDPGETLAVTADTLIEGRHFPDRCDPELAAQKALRVNLSDLAAMGARPFGYVLNIIWPAGAMETRAEGFVEGLAADQTRFGVRLIGGDTTSGPGPWSLSITAFGRRPAGLSLRRSAARPGDALVATGVIGDAHLGLKSLSGELVGVDAAARAQLERRSLSPWPRLEALAAVRAHARAVIDVSDGVLADARHLAEESHLRLELDLEALPVSKAAGMWLGAQAEPQAAWLELAGGGDDYELLIAAPDPNALIAALARVDIPACVIGRFTDDEAGVDVRFKGRSLQPERWGFTHF